MTVTLQLDPLIFLLTAPRQLYQPCSSPIAMAPAWHDRIGNITRSSRLALQGDKNALLGYLASVRAFLIGVAADECASMKNSGCFYEF
jgi:hypothetical protein